MKRAIARCKVRSHKCGGARVCARAGVAGEKKGAVQSTTPSIADVLPIAFARSHPHSLNPHTWHFTHPSANSSCEPQSGQVPMNDSLPPPFADSNVI